MVTSWNHGAERLYGYTADEIVGQPMSVLTHSSRPEKARELSLYARSLIEASLDPLVTIRADGKITDVNEATINVTGVERERLNGGRFHRERTRVPRRGR